MPQLIQELASSLFRKELIDFENLHSFEVDFSTVQQMFNAVN